MAAETDNSPTARLAALGAAALLAVAGCHNEQNTDATFGQFAADGQERAVDRFGQVQSAAAARADATLNGYHFDNGRDLNSLGRAKLDGMTRADVAPPLVIYLDLPRGSENGHHEQAIRTYLADHGLADDKVEVRDGPNPNYTRPAKDGLRGLKRLEEESGNSTDSYDGGGDAGGLSAMTPTTGSK